MGAFLFLLAFSLHPPNLPGWMISLPVLAFSGVGVSRKLQELKSMHKRSLRITMGLVFGSLMLIGGLSVGMSLWATWAQRHDALVMNLAGRQRMLSQKTAKEAWLGLVKGQDPHSLAEMHTTAHQFEEGLRALRDGGQLTYAGTTISLPPATDPRFQTALAEVQATWEPLHRAAHTVLEKEPGSPAFTRGMADLERLSGVILEKMDEVVRRYQVVAEARVARLQWLQLAFLLAGAAMLALSSWLILAQVLRPVSVLQTAIEKMERGDLEYPVRVRMQNELGRLAQTFDGMRGRIKALTQEQTSLLRFSQTLLGLREPETIARAAFEVVREHLPLDAIGLYIPDAVGTHLEMLAAEGWMNEHIASLRRPLNSPELSGAVWAVHTRAPVLGDHTRPDRPFAGPEVAEHVGVKVCLHVPMLTQERVVGVLTMNSLTPRTYTDDDVRFLTLVTKQVAIALENARLYEALRLSALQLEAKVEDRTRDLQEAMRQLEEASRHKSEFLANMSHELRTPLNSIIGFSEILQDQTFGPLNEKQLRYVSNIHISGKHLLALINDILDLSKVEAGKIELHPEPFALREALAAALHNIQPQADAKGLTLALHVDEALSILTADPVRFKQILLNLLSNAVKFTPEGGQVTVRARRVEDVFVEIAVTDTGIGIKPEDLPKLFQPFTQLEGVYAKRHQGTGLGLALTKRLVELHGGTIWADSEGEGKGSTFTVRLPPAKKVHHH